MLLRVVNRISRLIGRLPDLDRYDTALPYLSAVLDKLLRSDRRALRPNYAWAMVHTAFLASSLKLDRISALEFGVAGGNGLVALERTAAWLDKLAGGIEHLRDVRAGEDRAGRGQCLVVQRFGNGTKQIFAFSIDGRRRKSAVSRASAPV